jgi:S1-C subfamily serine protease
LADADAVANGDYGLELEEQMQSENQGTAIWGELSVSFADIVSSLQDSIVAVQGGGRSTSSGVLWRPGIIVTVRHPIRRTEGIKVIHRRSETATSATLMGSDRGTDLAVLRVDSAALKAVTPAEVQDQRVGDLVLSVGRSGLGDISASAGIIARLGNSWRTWQGGNVDRLIRPDVTIYVGLAGSALVDRRGQVLGINTTALARSAVITVPVRTIDRVVNSIIERGHVPRPYLGLGMQAVSVPESIRVQIPQDADQILLVMHLEPVGPATQGGLLVGDLVISLNGEFLHSVPELQHRIANLDIGASVSLDVIRGGKKMTLTLNVGDRD